MNLLEPLRSRLGEHYDIVRELGRGGMAVVFEARDIKHERQVAVKVLKPEIAQSLGSERFLREIEIEAGLQHPHILPLYDSGQAQDLLYYVMPLVEGESLRARMEREGQLPLEDAYAIARDVADGLSYAHSRGIVHRDIKPANILLTGDHALVADFGIAAAITAAGGDRLTESGVAIGTPQYMSPEQAGADQRVDPRSDVYALGCVLYEMLAGEAPFSGPTAQGIMRRHQLEPPPPLAVVRPTVPRAVVAVVEKALQKVPADRYRTATEFREALARAALTGTPETLMPATLRGVLRVWTARFVRLPRAVQLVAVAALVFGALALVRAIFPGHPSWENGRPESLVVLPFEMPTTTAAERDLASDIAAAITRELAGWETIRVVPQVALAGPMFDLHLAGPTLTRVEDGTRLARGFGVQAFVTVTARTRGDSTDVDAGLFDARTGRAVGRGFRTTGRTDAPATLAVPIALGLVGLDSVVDPSTAPHRQSANPEALIQDVEGQRALEHWRLTEAERRFRDALALDSAFAMAHLRLAQTLYWQGAEDPDRFSHLGPEIVRHGTAAVRYATDLPTSDSLHTRAFYAFQEGDYEEARSLYRQLIARDSADVYAWLMLGSVEFKDPWLTRAADGNWMPRSNYNVAVQAFSETLRLQPTFDLGYGHLFDIHREVVQAIDRGVCTTFDVPHGEWTPPWQKVTPQEAEPFCPVPYDTIVWVPDDQFDARARAAVAGGADRLFAQSLRLLQRWSAYAPEEPKPWNELVTQILWQRSRLGLSSPRVIDSLSAQALTYARRALAVSRDTAPISIVRLGALYLGVDSVTRAITVTERALAQYGARPGETSTPPQLAANVLLATGQPTRALRILVGSGLSRYVRDTTTGTLVAFGSADPLVDEIQALGALQVGAPLIREKIAEIGRIWSGPRYTPQQERLLRQNAALGVAPALLLVPGAAPAWDQGLAWDEPLWRAVVTVDTNPEAARPYLRRSLEESASRRGNAWFAFLQGVIAARIGDHAQAASLFARMDSVPLALDHADLRWGLRWSALRRRAEAYEALGRWSVALDAYERFAHPWAAADPLTDSLVDGARRRAAAIRARR